MDEAQLRKIVQEWLDAGRLRYNKNRTRIENPGGPGERQEALGLRLMIQLALMYGLKPKNEKDYGGWTRGELRIAFERAELPLKKDWDKVAVKKKGKAA
jgi:hypothetical protein